MEIETACGDRDDGGRNEDKGIRMRIECGHEDDG